MKTNRLVPGLVGVGLLLFILNAQFSTCYAVLRAWTGGGGANQYWSDGANWSTGVAPVAGQDVQFGFQTGHPNSTNDNAAGTTFNSIQFTHGGNSMLGTEYVLAGNAIALNAGVSASNVSATAWANTINTALTLNSNQTFGTTLYTSLAFQGPLNLSSNTLTFDTASSAPIDVYAVISGAGGLIKTNPGTLTLYSNNTYTGSTVIVGGTFVLNGPGAIPNSTNITLTGASTTLNAVGGFGVGSGQTLSGSGQILWNLTVGSGGVLSAGNLGVGTLTCDNNATLNAGATLVAVLNGTNAGTGYNQLNVHGTLALGNATLSVTLGYTPAPGDSFVIITNAGASAVSGTFAGLAEGAYLTNNGVVFQISYAGGDGNDVVLTRANVPVTRIVTTTADSGAGSLRAALAAATSGDIIGFAPNVTGVITLTSGELSVSKSVIISGPGSALLAVNGNAAGRVFHITNGVTAVISGLGITNGNAGSGNAGGGIYNDHSTLTVSNCVVSGNTAPGTFGGGIYNNGASGAATLTLVGSTVSGNSTFNGGGVFNSGESAGTGTVNVVACTISGNTAIGSGGGIYSEGNSSGNAIVIVSASTFSGNSAGTGGGILNDGVGGSGTLKIGDTILNTGGASGANLANVLGTVTSYGYNLCSDSGAGFLTNATDRVNTDPLLGPLANNGGPTLTHALPAGSPAVDQGRRDAIPALALAADQRGVPRPLDFSMITNPAGGDGSDIGAYELVPPAQFTSVAALANSLQLQGAAVSNLTYTIQAATNLSPVIQWTNLGVITAGPNGVFTFIDTNAPRLPRRFYRLLSP